MEGRNQVWNYPPATSRQRAQERCVWVARPDSHPYGVGMDRITGPLYPDYRISGNLPPECVVEVFVGSTLRFASLWSRDGPDNRPSYIRTTGYLDYWISDNLQHRKLERCVQVARTFESLMLRWTEYPAFYIISDIRCPAACRRNERCMWIPHTDLQPYRVRIDRISVIFISYWTMDNRYPAAWRRKESCILVTSPDSHFYEVGMNRPFISGLPDIQQPPARVSIRDVCGQHAQIQILMKQGRFGYPLSGRTFGQTSIQYPEFEIRVRLQLAGIINRDPGPAGIFFSI